MAETENKFVKNNATAEDLEPTRKQKLVLRNISLWLKNSRKKLRPQIVGEPISYV